MKLSATRDVLLKPLQAVIGVVERRQTMPILSNVLLVAKQGELSVTATDLEVELVAQANVDVQTGGEITVSGRKLLDICRALPEGSEVSVSVSGEKLHVRSGRSKFALATLPAAEFPSVEDIKDNGEGWEPRAGRKVVVNTSHAARVAVHVAEISGLMAVRILVCGVYRITPPFGRYSLAASAPDMIGLERAVLKWAEETYGDDVLSLAEGDYRSRA